MNVNRLLKHPPNHGLVARAHLRRVPRLHWLVRSQRGQMLVVGAIILATFLGFVGLVTDTGFYYAQRRQAQNAADEASFAGAHALAWGSSPSAAETVAIEYALANGFDPSEVTANIPPTEGPFAGQPDHVEVIVDDDPRTFFIHAVLADDGGVSARGVAFAYASTGVGYALFANDSNCSNPDTMLLSGNFTVVNGGVHSNGNSQVPGNDNQFGGGFTYNCDVTVSGNDNSFDPPPSRAPVQEFPVSYTYSDFPCDRTFSDDTDLRSVDDIWVGGDDSSNELLPGVYCSEGKLVLSGGSGVTGEVTLVAHGEINISGNENNLTPHWNDVLMFTDNDTSSAIDISGNTNSFEGLVIAPNGGAKVQGEANSSLSGAVLANTISVSGEGFTITAVDYGQGGPTKVALVE